MSEFGLEPDARRGPQLCKIQDGGVLARFRSEFGANLFNLVEGNFSPSARKDHWRIEREFAGDNVDERFFGALWLRSVVRSPESEPRLVGEDKQVAEFVPLGVVAAWFLRSATVDDGNVGGLPKLQAILQLQSDAVGIFVGELAGENSEAALSAQDILSLQLMKFSVRVDFAKTGAQFVGEKVEE